MALKSYSFAPIKDKAAFKAQLAERFTGDIKNAKPNAPVVVYPRPDKEIPVEEMIEENDKIIIIWGIIHKNI